MCVLLKKNNIATVLCRYNSDQYLPPRYLCLEGVSDIASWRKYFGATAAAGGTDGHEKLSDGGFYKLKFQ